MKNLLYRKPEPSEEAPRLKWSKIFVSSLQEFLSQMDAINIFNILVGRTGSGGSNEPTATHDGCDIDENKGYTMLKTLLGSANNFTWQNNTQNC